MGYHRGRPFGFAHGGPWLHSKPRRRRRRDSLSIQAPTSTIRGPVKVWPEFREWVEENRSGLESVEEIDVTKTA
jgi:hypothetical protein